MSYDAANAIVPPAPPSSGSGGGSSISNPLRTRPASATGAAVQQAAQVPLPSTGESATVLRSSDALVPIGAGDGASVVLPIAGATLATLVAVLCALYLAGVPIVPWRRAG
ncbi:hypothetical protein ET445_05475 [Agromyces protaetiae]|uniref:Uncharacterized protein n=1 Tax=Agromyces protaetiae TaxID=2509455 RepID=A0A4P6FA91_9MICO|nr:hypothetical protein [Agromyces protaetiae]QAY72872.1 hypothetical protein ET445_05475 [Agromyces protaetiae]